MPDTLLSIFAAIAVAVLACLIGYDIGEMVGYFRRIREERRRQDKEAGDG